MEKTKPEDTFLCYEPGHNVWQEGGETICFT